MQNKLLNPDLLSWHEQLKNHSLYQSIKTEEHLKLFMETHVFAVWDFMSLLKRLQKDITCVTLPWRPSRYPKNVVRMINEIVLGEESDLGPDGEAIDHFSLYLKAMEELSSNPDRLLNAVESGDLSRWATPAEFNFVNFNLVLANEGQLHEVAAAFFFGREKLIPDMFTSILKDLKNNLDSKTQNKFPALKFYLERHIELDGGEHSHLASMCLESLCGDDKKKWNEAIAAGIKSLQLRHALWSEVESKLLH